MEKISGENISLSLGLLFVALTAFTIVFFFIFRTQNKVLFPFEMYFLLDSFMCFQDAGYCQILRDSRVMSSVTLYSNCAGCCIICMFSI